MKSSAELALYKRLIDLFIGPEMGAESGGVQYLSFREKITDPVPIIINKWLVPITKGSGHYVAYLFFKIFLVFSNFIMSTQI